MYWRKPEGRPFPPLLKVRRNRPVENSPPLSPPAPHPLPPPKRHQVINSSSVPVPPSFLSFIDFGFFKVFELPSSAQTTPFSLPRFSCKHPLQIDSFPPDISLFRAARLLPTRPAPIQQARPKRNKVSSLCLSLPSAQKYSFFQQRPFPALPSTDAEASWPFALVPPFPDDQQFHKLVLRNSFLSFRALP